MKTLSVHLVAAARPNFMKIAPLYHALAREAWCRPQIVHTGQHYDANMSDAFFRDLRLPTPHFHLEVGSGSHAEQTGGVMIAYEKVAVAEKPDWIVVVGDVNSTAACAMVGTKLWIPVVHLEAGLRSGDRRMPEEINRLVTDAICDVLWTPSPDADENLAREGVPAGEDRPRRQHHDRLLRDDARRDRGGRHARRWASPRTLRRGHAASPLQRGHAARPRAAGAAARARARKCRSCSPCIRARARSSRSSGFLGCSRPPPVEPGGGAKAGCVVVRRDPTEPLDYVQPCTA